MGGADQRRLLQLRVEVVEERVDGLQGDPVPLGGGEKRGDALPQVILIGNVQYEAEDGLQIEDARVSERDRKISKRLKKPVAQQLTLTC